MSCKCIRPKEELREPLMSHPSEVHITTWACDWRLEREGGGFVEVESKPVGADAITGQYQNIGLNPWTLCCV